MSDEPKRVEVKLRPVLREHAGKVTEPYQILERLLEECPEFKDLRVAQIKLFWRKDWPVDADGVVTGAQAAKATESERLLAEANGGAIDLKILLPEESWPTLEAIEKEHRIYHELCHFAPAKDAENGQKMDTKDRLLWRMRRHQIVAFHAEVARYGVERVLGHNEAMVKAVEAADRPMEKVWDDAEENGDWRKLPVAHLGLSIAITKRLQEAEVKTLSDLSGKMQRGGHWWEAVRGIGEKAGRQIEDAFTEFWRRRRGRPSDGQRFEGKPGE